MQGLWKGSKPGNACLGLLHTLGDPAIKDQLQSHAHKVTQSKHVGDLQQGANLGVSSTYYLSGHPTQPTPAFLYQKVPSLVLSKKQCGFSLSGPVLHSLRKQSQCPGMNIDTASAGPDLLSHCSEPGNKVYKSRLCWHLVFRL